ncbi:DcaP family trimeric outer membrane transporter [Desulfospira joergensenii]|uniref:DcaP family trimeric outer membrane transporter n=1 Tax=Desulfospira joergensenii TaxID=53329 RepID=UPI0003B447AA|nr:DcaP family trimeric outer membrane transporter [Desulfospira joergensenii]
MNCFKTCFSKMSKKGLLAGAALAICLGLAAGPASAVEFDVKNTKVNLGGYIKLYGMYDIDGNVNDSIPNGMGDEVNAYGVPLDGDPHSDESRFSMTARESRLFLKTSTPTDIGIVSTYLEGDYNSDSDYSSDTWSNSRQFRLRHAAGTLTFGDNSVLFGQTWSTFMDFAGAVPVMDLAGDPGQPFVRQPQVRFTHNFGKGHYIALAAENPDRGFTMGGLLFQNAVTESTETMPDFIAKYFWSKNNFHLSPKVLVRRFELNDKDTMAYAFSLTSHLGFGKGHKIYAGLTWGDGIGRYAGLGLNSGAGIADTGDIETVEYRSINTGVTFALRDDLAWTLGCGYSENDEDAYKEGVLSGRANKDAFAWHTMMVWKASSSIECALGFTSMQQEVMDGREGDMMKVQSYVKFSF